MTDPKHVTQGPTELVIVAVIGSDRPGIVACSSEIITREGCNIREMTQHAMLGQFASISLVDKPVSLSYESLKNDLEEGFRLRGYHLSVVTRPYENPVWERLPGTEPFVLSVWGRDRNDIIKEFSALCAERNVNIAGLRALPIENDESLQVFEVLVPADVDMRAWHEELIAKARSMGLKASLQHAHIFEAIHRVNAD